MTDKERNIVMNAIKMGGLFITCGKGEKINIMNTRWGTLGRMWNRDIFVLPVRKKKYSHELISKYKSFVVNIPTNEMSSEMLRCSNMSGKEYNKFKEFHFEPVPAKLVDSVAIAECPMKLECKVIYSADMQASKLNKTIAEDMYIGREYHTLFFGEIVSCTLNKHKN